MSGPIITHLPGQQLPELGDLVLKCLQRLCLLHRCVPHSGIFRHQRCRAWLLAEVRVAFYRGRHGISGVRHTN